MDPRRELAETLLRKAKDDLAMARRLADDPAIPDWGVGFHVQQAVEKATKAVLSIKGIEYPRTHNIAVLLDMAAEQGIVGPAEGESLILLTPFGALFRYDDMGPSNAEMRNLPSRAILLDWGAEGISWAERAVNTQTS